MDSARVKSMDGSKWRLFCLLREFQGKAVRFDKIRLDNRSVSFFKYLYKFIQHKKFEGKHSYGFVSILQTTTMLMEAMAIVNRLNICLVEIFIFMLFLSCNCYHLTSC